MASLDVLESHKIQTFVDFPQTLDFLRTGSYALCGVVLHHGLESGSGHCTVYCRMAALGVAVLSSQHAYCYFDCHGGGESKTCSWDDISTPSTQRSVYLLLYARVVEPSPLLLAGSLETPYARGEDSQDLLIAETLSARCSLSHAFSTCWVPPFLRG